MGRSESPERRGGSGRHRDEKSRRHRSRSRDRDRDDKESRHRGKDDKSSRRDDKVSGVTPGARLRSCRSMESRPPHSHPEPL